MRAHLMLAMMTASGISAPVFAQQDTGAAVEAFLNDNAADLFGFDAPLTDSAVTPASESDFRTPENTAADQILLAEGLTVSYLTRIAGQDTDMMEFLPIGSSAPTHLITCVEEGRDTLANIDSNATANDTRFTPSVQRISLADGSVETVLRGMDRCDGIRVTAWGTVLATEETTFGAAYEILNPLATTEHTILDRGNGFRPNESAIIVDSEGATSTTVTKLTELPIMAWEGLTVLSNGVVIGGDELRPGTTGVDEDGGAIFKFVPDTLRAADAGAITDLSESPLVSGTSYAMQASCRDSNSSSFGQTGQGCEVGHASWLEVDSFNARESADQNGATGFYRPEDLHIDPTFSDTSNPDAIRFCFANTGNARGGNFGEVVCVIDNDPALTNAEIQAGSSTPPATVNRFVEGDTDFNQPDNLAFQANGNLYVIEDNRNGDIWACLPDGDDRDIKSDGCVKMLSVVDDTAEPTGFIFHPNGRVAYVVIQHSSDDNMPLFDNFRTDDVLVIQGFDIPGTAE